MYVKKLKIHNFKSFYNLEEDCHFAPTTNLICGLNGQGKSNILRGEHNELTSALNFLADPLFMSRPISERDSFRAKTSESDEFLVEALLKLRPEQRKNEDQEVVEQQDQEDEENNQELIVTREYNTKSKTCKYKINKFEVSPFEYFTVIEKNGFWTQSSFSGLSGAHPGKMAVLKTPNILLLLEQIHGGQGFQKLRRSIDKEILGLLKVREELDERMEIFKKFKGDVSGKRTLLRKQAQLEREIDILKKVKTSRQVDEILKFLQFHNDILHEKHENLNKKLEEEAELEKLHEKLMKEKQAKLNQETRYKQILESTDGTVKGEQAIKIVLQDSQAPAALMTEAVKYSEGKIAEKKKQLMSTDDQIQSLSQDKKKLKQSLQEEEKRIQKEERKIHAQEKELEKLRKILEKVALEVQKSEMASIKFTEKDIKEKSAHLQGRIASLDQRIEQMKQGYQKAQEQVAGLINEINPKIMERKELLVEQQRLKQELDQIRREARQCEEKIISFSGQQQKFEPRIREQELLINKQIPDFKDARRVLKYLDQEGMQHYGLLVDCVEVDKEFKGPFERVIGQRALCSVVTSKPHQMMRELKGVRWFTRLGILSTELCKVMQRREEVDLEKAREMKCTRILDGVRLKKKGLKEEDIDALQNMLKSRLGHVVIAPSDKVALRCSRECNTTCVVRNSLEMFSDEGTEVETFHKTGYGTESKLLLHLYSELQVVDQEREMLNYKKGEVERMQKDLAQKEKEIKEKMDEVEVKINAIIYHSKLLEKEKQIQLDKIEEIKRNLEQEIKIQEKAFFELEGVKGMTAPERDSKRMKIKDVKKLKEELKEREKRVKEKEQEIKEINRNLKEKELDVQKLTKKLHRQDQQIEVMKVMRGGLESTVQALRSTLDEILDKKDHEEITRVPDQSEFEVSSPSRMGRGLAVPRRNKKKNLQLSTTAAGTTMISEGVTSLTPEAVYQHLKEVKGEIRDQDSELKQIQAEINSQTKELQTIMAEDPLQCHRAIRMALAEQRMADEMLLPQEVNEAKEIRIEAAGLTLKLKPKQMQEVQEKLRPFLDERKKLKEQSKKDLMKRVEVIEKELDRVRREIQRQQSLPQKMITAFDRMETQIEEFWKNLKLDELEASVEQAHKAITQINLQRIENLILAFKKLNTDFPRLFKYFEPHGKAEFIIQRVPGLTKEGIFRDGAIYDELSPEIAETMVNDYGAEMIQEMEVDSLRSKGGLELMRGDDYHQERNELQKAIEQRIGKMGSHITSLLDQTQAATKKTDLEDEVIEVDSKRADGGKLTFRKRRMNYIIKICVQFQNKIKNMGNIQDSEAMQRHNEVAMLSGGQQTIIGLCLHLAFAQMLNVPKMVILDEPDASLDYTYRAAFAELVRHNKQRNQFFVITFRPDLVPTMDKFFEVHYFGRYSQMRETNEHTAYKVITEALKEEERKKQRAQSNSPIRLQAIKERDNQQNQERNSGKQDARISDRSKGTGKSKSSARKVMFTPHVNRSSQPQEVSEEEDNLSELQNLEPDEK